MIEIVRKFYSILVAIVSSTLHRNHGSFIASSAAVQFLPLISAPIIARLYSPEAFGAYAVFYALAAIIGSSASLALQNVILLEDSETSAAHATLLSLSVAMIVSTGIALVLFCTPINWLIWSFGSKAVTITPWLPITIMVSSSYLSIYTWFIRKDCYSLLARNKVILGVSTMLIQIGIGLMQLEAIGFVIANLIGYGLAIMLLLSKFRTDINQTQHGFSFLSAKAQFRKHIDLPLFTVPAGLINTLSSQLPELMINKLFGAHMLGQYSLANRMVNMPLSFFASSVQDIFRQKASAENRETGNCKSTFQSFLIIMLIASVMLLVPVVLFVPTLFPIVFGQQWDESGQIIRAMVFLLAVRFVSSPLSYVWIIKGKQKMDLLWQIGLLIVSIIAFLASHFAFQSDSLVKALYLYSALVGLWYAFCIYISYKYSR